jgi:2-aminoethylphosphonate-pyruvate transaminase
MRRLLLNPGPTNIADEVRGALLCPDHSHRDQDFREALARVRRRLVALLDGNESHSVILFASSGTGANEAILSAVHGKILLLENGRYSARLGDIADRYGVPLSRLSFEPFSAMNLDAIETALQAEQELTHIAVVHLETTTGMLAPLRDIGALAQKYDKLLIVDSIASVGGAPFSLRLDNVAFCSVNPNKCLEGLPGIAFVLARKAELERGEGASRSFYFDLYAHWRRQEHDETTFTAPVQTVFAFDVALKRLEEEGYGARVARYASAAAYLRDGLRRIGIRLVDMPEAARSNIVIPAHLPEGIDFAALARHLYARGITIYTASGELAAGRFFVSPMGVIESDDLDRFLCELESGLRVQGHKPETSVSPLL